MNIDLQNLLNGPLTSAADIDQAFDLCVTKADIYEVISRAPKQFGNFELLSTDKDYTYFVIQNSVTFSNKKLSRVTTHEFYKLGGVLK